MDAQEIEQTILDRRLPAPLPAGQGWVMPHYDGLSIANLPATVAAMLGADLPGALPPLPDELMAGWLPGLRRVVLVLLDGLGYRLLQERWTQGEGQAFATLASAGKLLPLTSIFLSTTDAALISLRTGVPPAEHGWLAYNLYLRELGIAANAILLCPMWTRQPDMLTDWGFDPETIITVPPLADHLASAGISTSALVPAHFLRSAFTQMLYQGMSATRGYLEASDFWTQLRRLLAETRGQPTFLTAYWGGLDTLGHAYARDTDLIGAEFRTIDHLLFHEFLASLPPQDREGTLLLVTADHGQISTPPERILTASEEPEFLRHLQVPIVGESRAAFVYPRPGRAAAIRDFLEGNFPGWFTVLDSVEVLEAGLMGKPIADETYARAGELLVLPTGNRALQHGKPLTPMMGRHGGLSPEEMLVPLIGARLEALPS